MRMLLAVGITMMLAIAAQAQDCNCTGTELIADYTQDRVPDAQGRVLGDRAEP